MYIRPQSLTLYSNIYRASQLCKYIQISAKTNTTRTILNMQLKRDLNKHKGFRAKHRRFESDFSLAAPKLNLYGKEPPGDHFH